MADRQTFLRDSSGNTVFTVNMDTATRVLTLSTAEGVSMLQFDGANATLTVPGAVDLAAAVGTTDIADESVTTAKLDDEAVTTAKLADDAVTAAKLAAGAGSTAFPRTSDGATTLIAAATVARAVLIHVLVTTTFDAGDGAAPIFDIGETDTVEKFKADLTTGTAGDVLTFAGTLTAAKALLVTATAATGTTSTGAITVTAVAFPS